jgi:hypothetical protein
MKTFTLITTLALCVAGVTQLWLKPAKEEQPRVLIKSERGSTTTPICPVVGDGHVDRYTIQEQINEYGDKVVSGYIHCRKCETGALFPLESNPTTGRCSYCQELYQNTFSKE